MGLLLMGLLLMGLLLRSLCSGSRAAQRHSVLL